MEKILQELLEAGAHFGHQSHRWNPKMAPFIFTSKNKMHIIDLTKTAEKLEEAKKFAEKVASEGGKILFVGTKKQASDIVKAEAEKCGMPYVTERWLGGMITNFTTVLSRTKYMKDLKEKVESDKTMSKKERFKASEEVARLEATLGGIKELEKLPEALFIVDISKEMTAVREAHKLDIPIIAIVDTNVNPQLVDYPIPANDDAVKSISLIVSQVAEAIRETGANKKDKE